MKKQGPETWVLSTNFGRNRKRKKIYVFICICVEPFWKLPGGTEGTGAGGRQTSHCRLLVPVYLVPYVGIICGPTLIKVKMCSMMEERYTSEHGENVYDKLFREKGGDPTDIL